MNQNIDAELVINNLLEKNKQQTLQISVLESAIVLLQRDIEILRSSIDDSGRMRA